MLGLFKKHKTHTIYISSNNRGIAVNSSVNDNIIQCDNQGYQLTRPHIRWNKQPDPDIISSNVALAKSCT